MEKGEVEGGGGRGGPSRTPNRFKDVEVHRKNTNEMADTTVGSWTPSRIF
jgi:hypothetical protein